MSISRYLVERARTVTLRRDAKGEVRPPPRLVWDADEQRAMQERIAATHDRVSTGSAAETVYRKAMEQRVGGVIRGLSINASATGDNRRMPQDAEEVAGAEEELRNRLSVVNSGTLRAMYFGGQWDTRAMGGEEVVLDLLFPDRERERREREQRVEEKRRQEEKSRQAERERVSENERKEAAWAEERSDLEGKRRLNFRLACLFGIVACGAIAAALQF